MSRRTSISDSEFERAWTTGPEAEGYLPDAVPAKAETKAKKVEAEVSDEPKKSTAKTKAK